MNAPMPDHDSRTYVAPPRETPHLIADGEAVTLCCGRTPFELPRTERITVDPKLRNCRPAHPLAAFEAATVAAFRGTPSIEAACEVMHDAYEKAAVGAGWETQAESRKPWADVPEANKATMRAAVRALLNWLPTRPVPIVLGFDGSAAGAPVQVEITDAAVGAARTAYSKACRDIPSDGPARFRAALEAAAPLLGARPLLDRDKIQKAVQDELRERGVAGVADVVMELARPMPTVEELAVAFNNEGAYCGDCDFDGGLSCPDCKRVCEGYGKAILALLNGAGS